MVDLGPGFLRVARWGRRNRPWGIKKPLIFRGFHYGVHLLPSKQGLPEKFLIFLIRLISEWSYTQQVASIFVLTGGPCAGKSTLLREMEALGHPVLPEAASEVILEGRLHPQTAPLAFQAEVLRRQINRESAALSGLVFADRAVGDHFGYLEFYRGRGLSFDPSAFERDLLQAWEEALPRYRAVFILEQSPEYVRTAVRQESSAEGLAIHLAIDRAYRARHPRVIAVPWGPVEARLEQVLRQATASSSAGRSPPSAR
jgi:predicted ATPase